MRVIGGEFRSRRLKSMPGMEVRPTPDRLRETLFNVLAPRIQDAVFVDVYAGTGAVGIEAISRGAARAIFIEKSKPAAILIKENIASLQIGPRCEVIRGSAHLYLSKQKADIVFVDPPYSEEQEYELIIKIIGDWLPSLAIIQHDSRFQTPERAGGMTRRRILKQGDNSLSFYEPELTE